VSITHSAYFEICLASADVNCRAATSAETGERTGETCIAAAELSATLAAFGVVEAVFCPLMAADVFQQVT
jgi:hypothetical protein